MSAPAAPKPGMSGGAKFGIVLLVLVIVGAIIGLGVYFGTKKPAAAAGAAVVGTLIPANGLSLQPGVSYTGGVLSTTVAGGYGVTTQQYTGKCTVSGKVSMASTGVYFAIVSRDTLGNTPKGSVAQVQVANGKIGTTYEYPGALTDVVTVALKYDGTNVLCYVNGVNVPTLSQPLAFIGALTAQFHLGAVTDTVSNLTWDNALL